MNFSEIIGQSLLVDRMKSILASGRIVHAYLLIGPAGAGKKTLGGLLAKALVCQSEGDKPCGHCHSCQQYATGNHPDVKRITPDKTAIKVGQIREMQQDIQVKPYQSGRKVYLMENADIMTTQAQNALLKTLEEPPSYGVLILMADSTQGLLSTILSRCQVLRIQRRTQEQVSQIVQKELGVGKSEADLAARLSEGLPGKALNLAQSQEFRELRSSAFELVEKLGGRGSLDPFTDASLFLDRREEIDQVLDLLMVWLRDLLVYRETGEENLVVNVDKISLLKTQAKVFTTVNIKDMIEEIEKSRKMLKGNANFQLTIENMLLHFQGGKQNADGGRGSL